MNVLIINPHRSDFIFDSVVYNYLGRKSLKKYKYLQNFIYQNSTKFFYKTSSFYFFLNKIGLTFFDPLFLYFEVFYFKKINNLYNISQIKNNIIPNFDVVFCFGFSIRNIKYKDLECIANNSNLFIIHLSHYHLYADKLADWSNLKNVKFCSDSDITNNYFYNYFIDSKVCHFVLTYTIDEKFQNLKKWEDRDNKIISTGTFHEFEKIYNKNNIIKNFVSGKFNSLSLHPERRIVNLYASKLKYLDSFNSSMGAVNFYNNNSKLNQRDYFKKDIVSLYNLYKYAFVGEETIIGIPGIGIYEAILCGCLPIINQSLYKGTPLENNNISLNYNNMNDLIFMIQNFEKNFIINYDLNDFKKLQIEIKKFFSNDYQLEILYKNISV
jgi:hypothetical protein